MIGTLAGTHCGDLSGDLNSGGYWGAGKGPGRMAQADFELREALNRHARRILEIWNSDHLPVVIVDATVEEREAILEHLKAPPGAEVVEVRRDERPDPTPYAWLLANMADGDERELKKFPGGTRPQDPFQETALVMFSGREGKGRLRRYTRDQLT